MSDKYKTVHHLSLISIAEMKTTTKSNLGRTGFTSFWP